MRFQNIGNGLEFGMSRSLSLDINTGAAGCKCVGLWRTFNDLLVSLIPFPMIRPACTKTQPTGVSSCASAYSACWELEGWRVW
jgi:hypothetical protein